MILHGVFDTVNPSKSIRSSVLNVQFHGRRAPFFFVFRRAATATEPRHSCSGGAPRTAVPHGRRCEIQ